jgi:hypothetical protein
MKKQLCFSLLLMLGLVNFQLMQAQTDVTEGILTNAGFDASLRFKAGDAASNLGSANGGANIHTVEGWTIETIGDNSAASTFEYGYTGTLNGQSIPATDRDDGTTGGVLGISVAWNATVAYTQTVTLESGGRYGIKYIAYNSGPTNTDHSKVGWIPNEGTAVLSTLTTFAVGEWMEETVEFIVKDGAVGKIQVGISAPNTGSANVGRIFFDRVQLIYYGADKSGLTSKIAEANTLYGDGSGNKADALQTAITAAELVEADGEATQSEISGAIDTLTEAMLAYQCANASEENPVDMTDHIINPSFEFSNTYEGWVNNGMGSSGGNPGTLGFTKDGAVFAEKYTGPPGTLSDGQFYQIIAGLPNGTYVLTAAAQARINENGSNPDFIDGAAIFANHKETVVSTPKNDYTVTISIIDGTLKIGFKVIPGKGNWVATDNYRLKCVGADLDDMAATLQTFINEAKAITGHMQGAAATELSGAITQAEAAVATPTEEGILSAGARISAAINTASSSIDAYAALNEGIETITNSLVPYIEADKTDINAAIADAQGVYDAATANVASVLGAIETLQAAFNTFALANADEVPMDMTHLIANPSFEANQGDRQQTIPGWTKTGPANSEYCTRNDAGPKGGAFKTGNVYFQYWSTSRPDFSISQTITDLPNGLYKVFADAGGNAGTRGTHLYAGSKEVEVTTDGSEYEIEFILKTGSVQIGFKSVSRTADWAFADNFRLVYYGNKMSFDVSTNSLLLTDNALSGTFTVSSTTVENNIVLSGPAGLSIVPSTITPAQAAETVEVTVTWDPEVLGSSVNNLISINCEGTIGKTITVAVSNDATCSTILYPEKNLIEDPYFNNSVQPGWGNGCHTTENAYCGAYSGRVLGTRGGSIERTVIWQPETAYIIRAYVNTNGVGFVLGLGEAYVDGVQNNETYNAIPNTNETWQLFENTFISGASAAAGLVWFNNYASGNDVNGYIDNYELYEAWIVSFDTDGGSAVDPVYVVKGEKIAAAPVTTLEGYKIAGWYKDSGHVNAWNFETDVVDSNMTLYVDWDLDVGMNLPSDAVIKTEYFSLTGTRLESIDQSGLYIVKKIYESGKTEVLKQFIKHAN